MVTDVSGNSEAFQLANVGDPRVKSASVAELVALTGSAFDAESHIVLPAKPASTPTAAAIFSNNPYPVRTVALNVVRFAFVLIGIGLLLRVGSAEQAVSAIEEERLQVQRPLTTKLVPPQPAFAYEMKDQTKTGSGPSLVDPVRHALRQGAFAAEGNTSFAALPFVRESAAAQPNVNARNEAIKARSSAAMPAPMLAADTNAAGKSSTAKGAFGKGIAGSAASAVHPTRLAAVLAPTKMAAEPSKLRPIGVPAAFASSAKAAQASAAPASTRTPSQALIAPNAPLILWPTRRTSAVGLLAPIKVASWPVTAIAKAEPAHASGFARPAAVSTAPSSAAPRAPALARSTPTAPNDPVTAGPVKISLALPVMRPGPSTTVLTSDIHDVMRRPASAWDYAETLLPELNGRAGQRSASAQPQAGLSHADQSHADQDPPSQNLPAQPQTAQVSLPQPAAKSAPLPVASPKIAAGATVAAPVSGIAKMPTSDSGRTVAQAKPRGRPVALLDLQPGAAHAEIVSVTRFERGLLLALNGPAAAACSPTL